MKIGSYQKTREREREREGENYGEFCTVRMRKGMIKAYNSGMEK